MENQNVFQGLPGLGDEQGLQDYLNQQAVNETIPDPAVSPFLQQNGTAENPNPQPEPLQQQNAQTMNVGGVQYTADEIQAIIEAYNAQRNAAFKSSQTNPQAPQNPKPQPSYTPQQAAIIKQLIDNGVPLERIQNALNGNQQTSALAQKLDNIERYLQLQQYYNAEAAFINKMTNFGNKFGLSEADLVTFAEKAAEKGMNLTGIDDVEAVFRVIYPDQYAIRVQRMSKSPTSQIFGGTSVPEAPRAMSSQMEDAYVERFLKGTMPNQYNKK